MIALDTNVLLRFVVADDDEQHRKAYALIKRAIESGDTCFIPDIALAEFVWVLRSGYKLSREEIADVLRDIYAAKHFTFSHQGRLHRALSRFLDRSRNRGDFADYLIQAEAADFGCEAVYTFDKALLGEKGFKSP